MFTLDETESAKAEAFRRKYRVTDLEKLGCCDGQFSYIFTPTTIGLCVSIKDNISGAEENITNFEDW